MSRPERQREIRELRIQGALARSKGTPRSAVPWKPFQSANADHWLRGWDTEDRVIRQREQNDRECVVTDAISEVDDAETQAALYAIWEYVKEKLGDGS